MKEAREWEPLTDEVLAEARGVLHAVDTYQLGTWATVWSRDAGWGIMELGTHRSIARTESIELADYLTYAGNLLPALLQERENLQTQINVLRKHLARAQNRPTF